MVIPPPNPPQNPYLNALQPGAHIRITHSGMFDDVARVCEDEADMKQHRYNRAVTELRGETRILLFFGLLAVAVVSGVIWALIHYGVLLSVLKWAGLAGAALGSFYGTAELIFRWRRKRFDEEYAIKLMQDQA